MCAKTTFSITYYCRESKTNKQGLAPLELCININQIRLFLNLPSKFKPTEFNKKRRPSYIEDLLNQYRVKVNEVISHLLSEGIPITAHTVKEFMKTGGNKSFTLQTLFDEYIKCKEFGKSTYNKYIYVRDFLYELYGKDKEVSVINNGDAIKVYEILKNKYMLSTSAGYMTKIKAVFGWAMDNGYIRINPFASIKVVKGSSTITYLTHEEIKAIKTLDLAEYPRLDKVRDLLLFQLSCGLAYVDMVRFNPSNLTYSNNTPIYIDRRSKTNIEFIAVILKDGMNVLTKYNNKLPMLSNQKYNMYLKDLQRIAGIKTNLTTHILRKTYAHILLNSGARIEVVAKCLGHSNTNITHKIYCSASTNTITKEISSLNISL